MYTCKVSGLCLIMGNRRFQNSLFVGKGRGTMVVFDKPLLWSHIFSLNISLMLIHRDE